MSFSINEVRLIGNLTRDVELRTTSSNKKVATISLATNQNVKAGNAFRDIVAYMNITVWDKMAEYAHRELVKGDRVYVAGRIQHRQFVDVYNQKRTILEIIALNIIPMVKKDDTIKKEEPEPQPITEQAETQGFNPDEEDLEL